MRRAAAAFVSYAAAAISLMRVWFKAVTCLSLQARPHSRSGSMVSARTEHRSGRGRGSGVASYWPETAGMVSLGQLLYSIHYLPFHQSVASLKKAKFIKNKPKDSAGSPLKRRKMRVQWVPGSLTKHSGILLDQNQNASPLWKIIQHISASLYF